MTELRILVVDDIQENLKLFKLLFESIKKDLGFDFALTTVDSAEEGLRLNTLNPFDLILSDERLGGMNGTQFYNEVKKASTLTTEAPFVIVSAKTTPKDWLDFFKSGVTDFLPKPISAEKLRFLCRFASHQKGLRETLKESSRKLELFEGALKKLKEPRK